MTKDTNPERIRELTHAWRSVSAHALARELVIAARSEGASEKLQAKIAEIVLSTEAPPTEEDIAHALRE